MSEHTFCQAELASIRREARKAGVKVPKFMTAIKASRNLYFVEMHGRGGEYVKGDCAWDAKARFIGHLIATERTTDD